MKAFIKKLRADQGGFTIIEVMIVMALAGLMIGAVVVAVPQLQRSQRNAVRRDVLGRIKTEIEGFAGNNNGTYPVAANADTAGNFGSTSVAASGLNTITQTSSFAGRYLKGVNINDPSTGGVVTLDPTIAIGTAPGQGVVKYFLGAECATDGAMAAQTGRKYAVSIGLEGGATYCLDNK